MNSKMDVHFSSKTDLWSTPQKFFDEMNKEFGPFQLDVACDETNNKCPIGIYTDSLMTDWTKFGVKLIWMNPPYGRGIGEWVKKAYKESRKGCRVVCLLPARTDTKWFHEYCMKAEILRFLKGRLKFGNAKNSAPFPSMIVVFDGLNK